jgi:Circularly permutated YpsA SLOG family
MALVRIISGGQTGADQGGLLAARELGIATGGTAPQGWQTETGPRERLLEDFGLVESRKPGYPSRTRQNVLDADGTLLVGQYRSGGSALTVHVAREVGKPLFHLALSPGLVPDPERIKEFQDWLQQYDIRVLNVAGNRESDNPGIEAFTRQFLMQACLR